MSDVTETLQELMERRLRELGQRRGRGESISLHEAYERLLESINGENAQRVHTGEQPVPPPPTYEVFRRIRNGHSTISDTTAAALATMLEVPMRDVFTAMGVRPPLGRFELPQRADRLDERERRVIVGVVDAILDARAEPAMRGRRGSGKLAAGGLRAVAETGDQADAEKVDELARRDREQHESHQQRDE